MALLDEACHVQGHRVVVGLVAHDLSQTTRSRECEHLLRLRRRDTERVLAVDVLPSFEYSHHGLEVQHGSDGDADHVDVVPGDELLDAVKGMGDAESVGRLLRRLSPRGADRHHLAVAAQGGESG